MLPPIIIVDRGGHAMGTLSGKNVLVTGASRGIGRAIALGMADAGARLILVARSDCDETRREIVRRGGEAFALRADIADESQIETMFAEVGARVDRLDMLVNNAGVMFE